MLSRKPLPLVRVLFSASDECLADMVADLVHEMSRTGVTLAVITPPTILDKDLLETAAQQHFDVAVLRVNNIYYAPYSVSSGRNLARDSLRIVKQFVALFHKPVIALYGSPSDNGEFATKLIQAGAAAAFQTPCPTEDIQQALKRCLPIW